MCHTHQLILKKLVDVQEKQADYKMESVQSEHEMERISESGGTMADYNRPKSIRVK